MREGPVVVAGRLEADHNGPSDRGELLGKPIIVRLGCKHCHAPAPAPFGALNEHFLAVLRHVDRYQHGVGGCSRMLGHGRSASKVLSRQPHFRTCWLAMTCPDAACGRFAALPPSGPWRLPSRLFPMCYGIHFTTPGAGGSAVPLIKKAIANGELFRAHAFEYACALNDIDHRTTKPKHPWTNGQVERMNR